MDTKDRLAEVRSLLVGNNLKDGILLLSSIAVENGLEQFLPNIDNLLGRINFFENQKINGVVPAYDVSFNEIRSSCIDLVYLFGEKLNKKEEVEKFSEENNECIKILNEQFLDNRNDWILDARDSNKLEIRHRRLYFSCRGNVVMFSFSKSLPAAWTRVSINEELNFSISLNCSFDFGLEAGYFLLQFGGVFTDSIFYGINFGFVFDDGIKVIMSEGKIGFDFFLKNKVHRSKKKVNNIHLEIKKKNEKYLVNIDNALYGEWDSVPLFYGDIFKVSFVNINGHINSIQVNNY